MEVNIKYRSYRSSFGKKGKVNLAHLKYDRKLEGELSGVHKAGHKHSTLSVWFFDMKGDESMSRICCGKGRVKVGWSIVISEPDQGSMRLAFLQHVIKRHGLNIIENKTKCFYTLLSTSPKLLKMEQFCWKNFGF